MTSLQITEYRKGAVAEMQRVGKIVPGTLTVRRYNEEAIAPYGFKAISGRLKLKFNELKASAGLSVNKNRSPGNLKYNKRHNNTIERRCNMSHCGKLFEAIDHMRSCPACTNLKNNSAHY